MDKGKRSVSPDPLHNHAGGGFVYPEKAGNYGIGLFVTDNQFVVFDLDAQHLHFLGETEPVLDTSGDAFSGYLGAHPFLADQEPLKDQLVDGLPEGVAGYVQLFGQIYLVGKHPAIFVIFAFYQFP